VAVWSLNPVTREVEMNYLGIVPAARGQGRARQLLEEVCGNTRELGADAIELNVDIRNRAAIMLYETSGFQELFRKRLWISGNPELFSTGSTHPASDAPVF
jgi:ribosomal protein S18 acetylase RimI-like enzyme